MSKDRFIELEVNVAGTPEEVWRAIATGPGISSWYVPHTVEEHEGGAMTASFGSGPEMQVVGRVAAWEPPDRVVFDGGEGVDGLAFEWLVEARDGGMCRVALANSGFGSGDEWDEQFDAMGAGWLLFLSNLRLHLEHFSGQTAVAMLPTATWHEPRDQAWDKLRSAMGIDSAATVGERIAVTSSDAPSMAGTIAEVRPRSLTILLDAPGPGTAFIAAEGRGDQTEVSIWSYLYGSDEAAVEIEGSRWQRWLGDLVGSVD